MRRSGISALRFAALFGPVPTRGRSCPGLAAVGRDRDRRTGLEVQAVGVELRRRRVAGTVAVERVEVQARGPALEQVDRTDVVAEHHVGAVHGEVVVDELAEVGVAGRHVAGSPAADDHRAGQLPGRGRAEGGAPGADPGEPERRRDARRPAPAGPRPRGDSDSLTGSTSSPLRPPTCVVSRPSPSMKKLSEPCFMRASTWVPRLVRVSMPVRRTGAGAALPDTPGITLAPSEPGGQGPGSGGPRVVAATLGRWTGRPRPSGTAVRTHIDQQQHRRRQ